MESQDEVTIKESENIEKEGDGSMLDFVMPEHNIEDMVDLMKQMVIYQKMGRSS